MRARYNSDLKSFSRELRLKATNAEMFLCYRIRRKQILNLQFYRQKPIGNYIVDFFAPKARLIIEIDGSQHFEKIHFEKDKLRDDTLKKLGYKVLRFDNRQVLCSIDSVCDEIYNVLCGLKSTYRET